MGRIDETTREFNITAFYLKDTDTLVVDRGFYRIPGVLMNFVRLLPVFLSFLLIAAHFQRAGFSILAIVCLLAPALLYITRPWSIRIIQMLLFLAALEWCRTLLYLVQLRQDADMPWLRMAIIIGAVALFTAASTLVFRHGNIKRKYFVRSCQ